MSLYNDDNLNEDDLDILGDLENLIEETQKATEQKRSAREKQAAKFQTEKLEDRVLFSATWIDAEVDENDATESNDDTVEVKTLESGGSNDESNDVFSGLEENTEEVDEAIRGTEKNETLRGTAENDQIVGEGGDDTLYGFEGDDTFVYEQGDGADRVVGGEGNDTIDATNADTLRMQHVTKSDSVENIEGSDSGTRIEGTDGYNHFDFRETNLENVTEIDAKGGNDYVQGSQADDVIIGGKGNDSLYGNGGDDTFIYNKGDGVDRFVGGEGEDTVDASDVKNFKLQHMTGSDSIENVEGSESGTKITGTSGYNHFDFRNTELENVTEIDAKGGNDYVQGSQADDVIIGGKGNDSLYGNGGDDTFIYKKGDGLDRFNGGEGSDTIDLGSLGKFKLQHMTGSDSIEHIEGSESGTKIIGTSGYNHFDFRNTDLENVTEIDAKGGNDYVQGSQADDVIIGGRGNDSLYGNGGDDTFIYKKGDGLDRFNGGEGYDTIDVGSLGKFKLQHMTGSDSIEHIEGSESGTKIIGTSGYNHFDFRNTDLENVTEIDAKGGNDYVQGSQADDVIIGGKGNDSLYGNGGDDTFIYKKGDGLDRFNGGEGSDTIDLGSLGKFKLQHMTASDSIETIEGSEKGTKIIGTSGYNHFDFRNTDLENVTQIDAKDGNDYVQGSQADDVIIGGKGNDSLYGNGGDDTFIYKKGHGIDRFVGGEGDDTVDARKANTLQLQHMTGSDSIEEIQGKKTGTQIEGTDGYNHFDFRNTNLENVKEIDAKGGNDYVQGSQADDVIIGGTGNDSLYGNGGDDTFVYNEGDGVDRFVGGEGNDTVDASNADTLQLQHMTGSDSIEEIQGKDTGTRIEGTDGYNHLDFRNTNLENVTEIDAKGGNDYVQGSQADDVFIAGEGNDRFYGNDGDDTVVFTGNWSDYNVTKINDTTFQVEDLRDGSPDGVDTVYGVETLAFADGNAYAQDGMAFTHESLTLTGDSVDENSAGGTFVGTLGSLSSAYTYEIVDSNGESVEDSNFKIVGNEIQVADGADLNYEELSTHTLTIRSTDADGNEQTRDVEIYLNDVNDAPVAVDDYAATEYSMHEDFDDGDFDGWKAISLGNDTFRWGVDGDGEVTERSNAGHGFLAYDVAQDNPEASGATDYSITVDVDANTGNTYNNGAGLVFGYQDNDNYYQASWQDYSENYSNSQTHKDFVLFKVENGNRIELDRIEGAELPDQFEMGLTVSQADGIQVQINGETLLASQSEVPELDIFGLYTRDNDFGVSYDNVQVDVTEPLVTAEDSPLNIDPQTLLANDVDEDGDEIKLVSVQNAEHGTVQLNEDGTITFTPEENYSGKASFTYTAESEGGLTTSAVVTIDVTPENDAVTDILMEGNQVEENSAAGTTVGFMSAVDADSGDSHSFEIVDDEGNVVEDSNFEIVGNEIRVKDGAELDFETQQQHQLQVRATDSAGESYTKTIDIDILNLNEGPHAESDSFETAEDESVQGNLLQNDSDEDGDDLLVVGYGQPQNGTVRIEPDGSFEYTPNTNFSGFDSFVYVVEDGNGGYDKAVVNVEVTAVADGVTLETGDASGEEDTAIDLKIDAQLLDSSESISEIIVDGVPSGAQLSAGVDNGDGSWTLEAEDLSDLQITPAENSYDDFELQVSVTTADGDDTKTVEQTIQVEVAAVNDAVSDLALSNASVAENSPAGTVVGTLSATDIDVDDSFSYEIVDADGNVVEDSNFEIVDDEIRVKEGADLNYEASDSHELYIQVTDSGGAQHSELLEIEVIDVNEGPTTEGESFSLNEDGSVSGNLLANDSDVDGDTLVISDYSQPDHGRVTIDADGNFVYQPDDNYSGVDSFVYEVSDGNGGTALESVNLEVVAVADGVSLNTGDSEGNEDESIDLEIDAQLLDSSESISNISISGVPAGAMLSAGVDNGDGSWTLEAEDLTGLQITPAENSHDDFELQVSVTTIDGDDTETVEQTIQVEVAAVNDAVSDLAISNASVEENSLAGTVVGTLSATDIDVDDSFSYAIVDADGNVVEDSNFEIVGDEIRVKEGADLNHEASDSHELYIQVTDSGGAQHSELLEIEIVDVNEGPTVQGEHFELNEDGQIEGNLLANDSDVDGDRLVISDYSQPEHGQVTIDADGNFVYQPDDNYSGVDSFVYEVSDGNGGTAVETVSLDVTSVADGVSLDVENSSGDEDTAIDLKIDAQLLDSSESISNISISGVPTGAMLSAGVDNGDGSWTLEAEDLSGLQITPAENSHDDFELQVSVTTIDGDDTETVEQTIQVEVAAVNDAVSDLAISNASVEENSLTGTVVGTLSATDIDVDDSFSYAIVDADGNVVEDSNFEIVGDEIRVKEGADLNHEASDSHELYIQVTDSGGAQHSELLEIEIVDVNEGPTVQGEHFELNEDGQIEGNLLANDSDVDGDRLVISDYSQPEHGQVTIDADGNFVYQPDDNYSGVDSFVYEVSDGNGGTAIETVSLEVTSVADGVTLETGDAGGDEDTAIDLKIDAQLLDSSESISEIIVDGVPSGAQLSAGVDNGDGSWTLEAEDLSDLQITPAENSYDDFELQVSVTTADGDDTKTVEQTIQVEVAAVNDAVSDLALSNASVAENSPAGTVVGTLSATDIDVDDSFSYEIVDADGNVVEDSNFEIVDDEIRVKEGADLNYEASDSHELYIQVTDSGGAQHSELLEIEVVDVNEDPTVQGERFELNEDGQIEGNLLANDSDVDGNNLVVSNFTQPQHGFVKVDPAGDFVYQPIDDYSGFDSFTYEVSDGHGGKITETVNFYVNSVADGVSLEIGEVGGNEDTPIDLNIGAQLLDTDGSESISSIKISGIPSAAALTAGVDNGDGSWTLTPDDLDGLQLLMSGLANDDFDLQITLVTVDGDSTNEVTRSFNVDLEHDTLFSIRAAKESELLEPNELPEDDSSESKQLEPSPFEVSVPFDEVETGFNTAEETGFDFAVESESSERTDWGSTDWSGVSAEFDANQDATHSEYQPVAEFQSQVADDLVEGENLPDPDQLVAESTEAFDQESLNTRAIQLVGSEVLPELDAEVDTSSLTASSLLLLFSTKNDERKRLNKVSRKEDN